MKQSRCHRQRWRRQRFCSEVSGFQNARRVCVWGSCNRFAETRNTLRARQTQAFRLFCRARHLSTGCAASDQSWSGRKRPRDCFVRPSMGRDWSSERSTEGWSGRSHIGLGLTCLSVRCLSSYLFFPPVPVASKLRVRLAQGMCQSESRTSSCAVSHLTTDRKRRGQKRTERETDLILRRNA